MGLPSGNFQSDISGRMVAVLNAEWKLNGQPYTGTAADLILRLRVGNPGSDVAAYVAVGDQTAWVEIDYTAGEILPVAVEYVGHSLPPSSTISCTNIRVVCKLLPPRQNPPLVSFNELLDRLDNTVGPMAAVPQTPRWEPDTPSGVNWYVRPLSVMATNHVVDQRYTALDTDEPDYNPADDTTWTSFANHPLAPPGSGSIRVRDANPIDPTRITVTGYANSNWSGPGTPMLTEIGRDSTSSPGQTLYYIKASRGPGTYAFTQAGIVWRGTATFDWYYADLATLDGREYETAWPGLEAIDWSMIQPGDTLWVCGEFENETLTMSGVAGLANAYVRIRLDYPTDPGSIKQGTLIRTAWTYDEITGEYNTPVSGVTDCMLYENERRLVGINSRSRCRTQVQHASCNYANNTISFGNIRRIQTGMEIIIGSDFPVQNIPEGLTPNTRYYAIVVSSNWQFYSVSNAQYTIKLAATYADAIAAAPVAVDFSAPASPQNTFFLIWVLQFDYPFYDQRPGELDAGQYCVDPVAGRLYYKPTGGVPGDYEIRIASESYALIGASIFGANCRYIKVLGGGEYGGLFPDLPAPKGFVGLGHQNVIEFEHSRDIVIDGLRIDGGRSGVTFIDTPRGTVRNCLIANQAHHACGGEDLNTVEPDQLLERNWITDIGQGHDFGDAQALVTNPGCHRTVFRRNYCQRLGRNTKVTNPVICVFDSSHDVVAYRNWADDTFARLAELGAGTSTGETVYEGCQRPVVACNVHTRHAWGSDPATNLIQRVGAVNCTLNQLTDYGVWDAEIFGNIFAFFVIGDQAPDTLDPCGVVYMRTNNNNGFGRCEIRNFQRNVVLNVDGPVFSLQRNSNSTVVPSIQSDYNLYATVPEFAQRVYANVGTRVVTLDPVYSGAQIIGQEPGYWSEDTSNDRHSLLAVQRPEDLPQAPTLAQLEFIRRWDAYDTYNSPTVDVVGNFPFA